MTSWRQEDQNGTVSLRGQSTAIRPRGPLQVQEAPSLRTEVHYKDIEDYVNVGGGDLSHHTPTITTRPIYFKSQENLKKNIKLMH